MLPHRACTYTVQLICTALIMTAIGTFDQARQPVGVEMCKDHCDQYNNCTFCVFYITRLTCVATWSKNPPQTNGEEAFYLDINKEVPGAIAQRKRLCRERQSRIVLTRSNGFRCIKLKTDDLALLFFAPHLERLKTPLRGFHLLNSSITTYVHIKPRYSLAMAYVPTPQKVLIANVEPDNIQAFSLHSNVSVTVRRDIYAVSIAVDDAQQLVFLATVIPFKCVTSMIPDGRNYKKIVCRIKPTVLCLDTRRDIVYVADRTSIYAFTYDGQAFRRVTSTQKVHGLTLGGDGDVMYYNYKTAIMEYEFKNGKTRKVTELNFTVRNLVHNNGYLYMSSLGDAYIHVWHESSYSRLLRAPGVDNLLIA